MTVVRQIIGAFVAVSLVWVGSAGAVQAHAHELGDDHGPAIHVATAPDADHRHDNHDDHQDHHPPADDHHDDGGVPHDQEKGIFHVHVLTFVVLEAEYLTLPEARSVKSVETSWLAVPLHTRSVMPADRPPRTFL